VRASLAASTPALVVRGETDVTLKVAADGAIVDFVRYPYAPLEPLTVPEPQRRMRGFVQRSALPRAQPPAS